MTNNDPCGMQSCINQHTLTKTTQQLAFHPNKHPIAQAKRKAAPGACKNTARVHYGPYLLDPAFPLPLLAIL
ncbi:hypothetical protein PCANC_00051 [Puccinia coronata f. sp. avenae]|uniref:Uncharacterized protein n=1 Tax=Puccinia coronata f. sp. avenae TaxID=200324 RepID=A0A2N5T1L9_9BASI|nr:hypothetical protein PCANC_06324 [Puccinia coronata f. sp. avenae]PLW58606.1 hypothetical protein PCANC_00051 [Puccinia coronata f. sp. avenae]